MLIKNLKHLTCIKILTTENRKKMKKLSSTNKHLFKSSKLQQALIIALCGLALPAQAATEQDTKKSTDEIEVLPMTTVQVDDLKDGSAEDGYRVDEISAVGPWQGRTLQETPYSINVVSESLIENLQATSPDQVYKIIPVIQEAGLKDRSSATMRGFTNFGVAHNGINDEWSPSFDIVMEQTAQIEVLTGLSGFFYGASNIGGTINYVSKKTDR